MASSFAFASPSGLPSIGLQPHVRAGLCNRSRPSPSRWRCTATPTAPAAIAVDGGVTAAQGFRAGGVTAGLKTSGLPDLAVVVSETGPASAGAVFTKNLVRAAPVSVSADHLSLSGGVARAIVLNSGQANAATGVPGASDAERTASATAELLGCPANEVLLCSTGVIGVRFDVDKLTGSLGSAVEAASATKEGGADAARAIMTTDLVPKEAAVEGVVGGKRVRVGGMCKGSGMIHPDMATMLAVVTCDAEVTTGVWQGIVARAADRSFNAITVDGDSSTNDTVFALAGGASGLTVRDAEDPSARQLEELVTDCMIRLAKQIARDGEGANVLVEVRVRGAANDADARLAARTIAESSLFKAAVFGCDPNWGRIGAAAGRAGVPFDQAEMDIDIGPHALMRQGQPQNFDAAAASAYLKEKANAAPERYLTEDDTVVVEVGLGKGAGTGVAWGCDLSYKYVEINAEYTT